MANITCRYLQKEKTVFHRHNINTENLKPHTLSTKSMLSRFNMYASRTAVAHSRRIEKLDQKNGGAVYRVYTERHPNDIIYIVHNQRLPIDRWTRAKGIIYYYYYNNNAVRSRETYDRARMGLARRGDEPYEYRCYF